jgi:hypothetical protein
MEATMRHRSRPNGSSFALSCRGAGAIVLCSDADGVSERIGTNTQADRLFQNLDSNGNGSVNSSELINFEMAFAQSENGKT